MTRSARWMQLYLFASINDPRLNSDRSVQSANRTLWRVKCVNVDPSKNMIDLFLDYAIQCGMGQGPSNLSVMDVVNSLIFTSRHGIPYSYDDNIADVRNNYGSVVHVYFRDDVCLTTTNTLAPAA